MQLFARQQVEDGSDKKCRYAPCRTELDASDPDGANNLPIPLARRPGKPSPYLPNPVDVRRDPAGSTVDCILLDVIDARPISFAYPLPSVAPPTTAPEPEDTVAEEAPAASRKRSRAGTAEPGPSEPPAKKKRLIKKAAAKPQKPRLQG